MGIKIVGVGIGRDGMDWMLAYDITVLCCNHDGQYR